MRNRPRYIGTDNYDETGFKFIADGILLELSMFKMAIPLSEVTATTASIVACHTIDGLAGVLAGRAATGRCP